MSSSAEDDYRYRGVPLTGHMSIPLIKELFARKLVERQEIINEVQKLHAQRGGLPSRAKKFALEINRALRVMEKAGEAENPSIGYWKILPSNVPATADDLPVSDISISSGEGPAEILADESIAEMVIGNGPASVYLYYLPTYRTRAEERGEHNWPCKIGRTDQNPLQRILAQAATALPEKPVVAVVFRTKYSAALEKAFHSVFTLRGLAMQDAPGSEWFLTSPDEVIALAKVFDPASFDSSKRT